MVSIRVEPEILRRYGPYIDVGLADHECMALLETGTNRLSLNCVRTTNATQRPTQFHSHRQHHPFIGSREGLSGHNPAVI